MQAPVRSTRLYQLPLCVPTAPLAGTEHGRESRNGGLDKLDQRNGGDPGAGHPHDDDRH